MTTATVPHRPRRVLRSVGAVLAGFLAVFIVTTVVDLVMHASGVFPPWGQPMSNSLFALATAYRVVITPAGGYITSRLAPYRPMWHAMILGVIGVALALAATVATWNRGPSFGPHWYPIALVITGLPCTWLGAMLYRVSHPEA